MIVPLLKGLKLTLKRFFSPAITIRYPEERRPVSDRWRGLHYFAADDKGETLCVACGLCVAACPSHCISLEIRESEDGTRYPGKYEIEVLRCIFCGFCQEACPVNAILLGKEYDHVNYQRADFLFDKERLLAGDRSGERNDEKGK